MALATDTLVNLGNRHLELLVRQQVRGGEELARATQALAWGSGMGVEYRWFCAHSANKTELLYRWQYMDNLKKGGLREG